MQIIDFYIIKQEGYRYYFNLISVKHLSKSDKLQAKYFYSNLCVLHGNQFQLFYMMSG